MKKILTFCFTSLFSFFSALAQSISYSVDSTSFSALKLDGGNTEVRFADINLDGNLDLLTVGDHGSPEIGTNEHGITVFFGNGTGTGWTLFQDGNFGYGGIAVGDVNNDQLPDVAYGIHHNYSTDDFGDQLIEAALGDGTGMNWAPWDNGLATSGESYGMFGTDLGDVNNDGLLDIGSNSFGCCNGVHIYVNDGAGGWNQSFAYPQGNALHYIQFGDVNHDGNLDFVVCNQNGSPYFGDGQGHFTLHNQNLPKQGSLGYTDVSLGDLDNDGDDDFAFISNKVPRVYKWDDGLQQWTSISNGLPNTGAFYCCRLADLDRDGFLDLVAVGNKVLKIWMGNGGTSWTNTQSFSFSKLVDCADMTIDDMDHNGFPDILFWAAYTQGINDVNRIKMLTENSVPSRLDIALNYPKGSEYLPNNGVRFIKWNCAVPNHDASSVRIEFSSSGKKGPWSLVAATVSNNGTYQWTIPASISSSKCFIRLIATDLVTNIKDTVKNSHAFSIGSAGVSARAPLSPEENMITIAPNPFSNTATVFSPATNCSLSIFDLRGKLVRSVNQINRFPFTIDRENLAPGVYIVELRDGNGKIKRQKLVVN